MDHLADSMQHFFQEHLFTGRSVIHFGAMSSQKASAPASVAESNGATCLGGKRAPRTGDATTKPKRYCSALLKALPDDINLPGFAMAEPVSGMAQEDGEIMLCEAGTTTLSKKWSSFAHIHGVIEGSDIDDIVKQKWSEHWEHISDLNHEGELKSAFETNVSSGADDVPSKLLTSFTTVLMEIAKAAVDTKLKNKWYMHFSKALHKK